MICIFVFAYAKILFLFGTSVASMLSVPILVYTVSTKRNAKFLMKFFGGKNIYCKNDSISVVLPFNKEFYSKVLS